MTNFILDFIDQDIKAITYQKQIALAKFGIKNDGTSPQETSAGLNQALQYAKEKGYSNIIFPKGIYLIDETNPIVIDLKNVVIDLNGSILQIDSNGLEKYSIVDFWEGAENVRLTNGTVRGDQDTHDYLTVPGTHEWGCGISFKAGSNLQLDNMTITNATGYGILIESGVGNTALRFYTLYTSQVVQGSISDDGTMTPSTTTTRTSNPYDISVCGGQFELGYSLGYQGYTYLVNREYTAYFYDKNMKFIQKKECLQFRKVDIPSGAKYVHFVYPQASVTGDMNHTYAWITNLKPPTNSKITNCIIKGNRCLGLAVCGGQQWVIEDNIFEGNGGKAANHAVDFEDGWELTQDYMFRNNRFINNTHDITVAAGDNLVFEGNDFTNSLTIWERATNYKVIGNKITGSSSSSNLFGGNATYRIKRTGCEVRDNQYTNCNVTTASLSALTVTLVNETFVDSQINPSSVPGSATKLVNSEIKAARKVFMRNVTVENCTFEVGFSEAFNLILKNTLIKSAKWNLHTVHYFENCGITDSILATHGDTTKIQFKGCEFINSQVLYNTWGAAAETVIEQCQASMTANLPLVRLSAGKTRNLIFINNSIVNQAAKPVIELYDTLYTVPNGNAALEGNSFALTNYGYVFDGVNITKGIFNFTDKNNTITGAVMLNPRYVGNPYFVIIT